MGVDVDLSLAGCKGLVVVSNRRERIDEDRRTISALLAAGRASPSAARSLRGRLQYAGSHTFGRCGAFANRCLRDLAEGRGGDRALGALEEAGMRGWLV